MGGNATAIAQVNSVSQLRDIAPGDWAFSALRNLVERYDCLDGYPNRTYQGNRALTRYEFAAGLNACMEQMERLITTGGSDSNLDPNELASIQKLLQEFEKELVTLGTRVNNLEDNLSQVEARQFSTTTKLEGNVIFAAIGASGNNVDQQVTFGHRTRLNFDASFTGEDNLRVRLQADGLNAPDIGTPQGALAYADTATNNFAVDALVYAFPLGDKTEVAIAANAGASDDFASTINALDGDGNEGALTAFGTRHPIYYQIEDKGIGINHKFSDRVALGLGYMAAEANNPESGNGLFNGSFGSMAQLTLTPTDNLELGFTYLRSYRQSDTGTGSNLSNFGAFTADPNNFVSTTGSVPISSDSYGIQASWQLHDNFILGGWGA
ncbi:MAG: carbohydrate porin [Synechococcaceae cyanobacterium RL_1_2]|nr:carbohydrate porin [Synechococcaceae cyanobacterium RL_1_2]